MRSIYQHEGLKAQVGSFHNTQYLHKSSNMSQPNDKWSSEVCIYLFEVLCDIGVMTADEIPS